MASWFLELGEARPRVDAIKNKAHSVGWRSKWAIVPRSPGAETNQRARVTGQLAEIYVMFMQIGDDAHATRTARACAASLSRSV